MGILQFSFQHVLTVFFGLRQRTECLLLWTRAKPRSCVTQAYATVGRDQVARIKPCHVPVGGWLHCHSPASCCCSYSGGKRYSGESVTWGKTLLRGKSYSGENVTRGKALLRENVTREESITQGKVLLKGKALLRRKRYSGESITQGKALLRGKRYYGESITQGKALLSVT